MGGAVAGKVASVATAVANVTPPAVSTVAANVAQKAQGIAQMARAYSQAPPTKQQPMGALAAYGQYARQALSNFASPFGAALSPLASAMRASLPAMSLAARMSPIGPHVAALSLAAPALGSIGRQIAVAHPVGVAIGNYLGYNMYNPRDLMSISPAVIGAGPITRAVNHMKNLSPYAASQALAAMDRARAEALKSVFEAAAKPYNLNPAVLAALASRETGIGRPGMLNAKGYSKTPGNTKY